MVAWAGHVGLGGGEWLNIAHEVVPSFSVSLVHVLSKVTNVDDGIHAFLGHDSFRLVSARHSLSTPAVGVRAQ